MLVVAKAGPTARAAIAANPEILSIFFMFQSLSRRVKDNADIK